MQPNIEQDFERFSKQHSWYKHLPTITTVKYYIIPQKGQQITHPIDPKVDDYTGIHWGFHTEASVSGLCIDNKLKKLVLNYPIECNGFLRGIEQGKQPYIRNYPRGMSTDDFKIWLKSNHPDLINQNKEDYLKLFEREHNKSKKQAVNASNNIWKTIIQEQILY